MIAQDGIPSVYAASGQTYSRKVDSRVERTCRNRTVGTQVQRHPPAQHMKEVEEPFEKIRSVFCNGIQAQPRSERMASQLCDERRNESAATAATQWFERTLMTLANKESAFLRLFATNATLNYINISDGLVVYPKVIESHLMAELPFMATENIMMMLKAGGDCQSHERIRELSMQASKTVKEGNRTIARSDRCRPL